MHKVFIATAKSQQRDNFFMNCFRFCNNKQRKIKKFFGEKKEQNDLSSCISKDDEPSTKMNTKREFFLEKLLQKIFLFFSVPRQKSIFSFLSLIVQFFSPFCKDFEPKNPKNVAQCLVVCERESSPGARFLFFH